MFLQPHQGDLWQQCYTNLISHLAKKMFAHQEACVVYLFLQNHGGGTFDYMWLHLIIQLAHIFFHCSNHCCFFLLKITKSISEGSDPNLPSGVFRHFGRSFITSSRYLEDPLASRSSLAINGHLVVVCFKWWGFLSQIIRFRMETIQVVGLIRGLVYFLQSLDLKILICMQIPADASLRFLLQFLSGQPGRGLWICEQSQDSASRHQDTNHDPTQKL